MSKLLRAAGWPEPLPAGIGGILKRKMWSDRTRGIETEVERSRKTGATVKMIELRELLTFLDERARTTKRFETQISYMAYETAPWPHRVKAELPSE